jgi:hypothetical protein
VERGFDDKIQHFSGEYIFKSYMQLQGVAQIGAISRPLRSPAFDFSDTDSIRQLCSRGNIRPHGVMSFGGFRFCGAGDYKDPNDS